jgi:hypothetical protein
MRLASRLAALVLVVFAAPASGLSVSFTKIADDSSHPAWTSPVAFSIPAVDDGEVVFFAESGSPYLAGIYTGNGGALTTIVDSNTLVPDSLQPFGLVGFWGAPTISEGNVAFLVNESGFVSVFASLDGNLTRIAADDGSGNLSIDDMRSPMIDGHNVAFRAWSGAGSGEGWGLFTSVAGVLETSADATTDVPGGAQDIQVGTAFALAGTSVAYESGLGVYVATAGTARVVADTATAVPGGVGSFTGFLSAVSADDGNIAFEAGSTLSLAPLSLLYGIYAEIDGVLVRIADTETLIPGSAETFDGFTSLDHGLSISGASVAFYGGGGASLTRGLYVYRDGEIHEVIEVGDLLDGKVVSGIEFGSEGFYGDQIAFHASFDDGTTGIYLANIPEPGSALLLAAGLSGLAASRRSRARLAQAREKAL